MSGFKKWCFVLGLVCFANASEDDFRINQLGYYPASNKTAIIIGTQDSLFEIINGSDETVFNGILSETIVWSASGDTLKQADFTSFTEEGVFRLRVSDKGTSYPFRISLNVLYNVAEASLKSFYYQRSSMALDADYAGVFARAAGHPDTLCMYHVSTGVDTSLRGSSPGGWYDAGDYGKYVVNAGITVGTMLSFYENYPDYFEDGTMNIPESGNGVNDLLDEVKYELDWLKTMQDSDGGVFHKLTTLNFPGMIMPSGDKSMRYFIGKPTSAALDFAAVMAMAGRIYESIDHEYAQDCITRAKDAWQWAVDNPAVYFSNPDDVGTGEYGNVVVSDEFTWAASELLITTGEQEFKDYLETASVSYSGPPTWSSVRCLASLSLATVSNSLDSSKVDSVRQSIITHADSYLSQIESSPYRIPNFSDIWGSNSVIANIGICLVYAYLLTDDDSYIKGAGECADYLLGKNATTYSFITGFGIRSPMNPHHRPSVADGITDPIPGLVVGGPNGGPSDYVDSQNDYEKNEVAINWSSPVTVLFAAVDKFMGNGVQPDIGPFTLTAVISGPGKVEISPERSVYEPGTQVIITAVPDSGELFLGWAGAKATLSNSVTLVVNRDIRIEARFGKPGELVINGDFSNRLEGWSSLQKNGTGAATGSVVDGEYKIDVTNGGTLDWHVQFVQSGLELLNGATYIFSFDARSDSARTLVADVAMNRDPWSSYMPDVERTVTLADTMQTFTFRFTMNDSSDIDARITFNAGLFTSNLFLDNVSLKMLNLSSIRSGVKRVAGNREYLKVRNSGIFTELQFSIDRPGNAWLKIFDLQGRVVKDLTRLLRNMKRGRNAVRFENSPVPGTYIIRYFDGISLQTLPWITVQKCR